MRALAGPTALASDIADLVLGRSCAGCETIGSVLCEHCAALLRQPIRAIVIGEQRIVLAAARYGGTARRVILDYKERGTHSLAPFLARMLADAVTGCLDASHERIALSPIPAHRAAVCRRGGDPLAALVSACAGELRSRGIDARMAPLLRSRLERPAAKSLGRAERAAGMRDAFLVTAATDLPIVLVDDIVTTGTTMHEAMDAFDRAHLEIVGAAALAATPLALPRAG